MTKIEVMIVVMRRRSFLLCRDEDHYYFVMSITTIDKLNELRHLRHEDDEVQYLMTTLRHLHCLATLRRFRVDTEDGTFMGCIENIVS